jgi:hypothetical protein
MKNIMVISSIMAITGERSLTLRQIKSLFYLEIATLEFQSYSMQRPCNVMKRELLSS